MKKTSSRDACLIFRGEAMGGLQRQLLFMYRCAAVGNMCPGGS